MSASNAAFNNSTYLSVIATIASQCVEIYANIDEYKDAADYFFAIEQLAIKGKEEADKIEMESVA
ncbi:MAG: hypothetical protein LBQ20_03455 [Rhodanobacter sp.]|jgi:hypothetical protein|nr:hypothetical protein [Rhodanobacter sp.]